jgi:hypothetical protein
MLCALVSGYQCLQEHITSIVYLQYEGDVLLRNIGNHLQDYIASQTKDYSPEC